MNLQALAQRGHLAARNSLPDKASPVPSVEPSPALRVAPFAVLFRQRNISPGNVRTLTGYLESPRAEVRERAQLLLEVARVKPHKRKRYGYLRQRHPDLLVRLDRLFGWPGDLPYEGDSAEEEEFEDNVPFPRDEDCPGEEVDRGL